MTLTKQAHEAFAYFRTWVRIHTVPDIWGAIFRDELWEKYRQDSQESGVKAASPVQCGQILAKVQSNIKSAKKRVEGVVRRVYAGIEWRSDTGTNISSNIISNCKQLVSDSIVVLKEDDSSATFGIATNSTLHSNDVYKFLTVTSNGSWEVKVLGKILSPKTFGFNSDTAIRTDVEAAALFAAAVDVNICHGCPIPKGRTPTSGLPLEKWRSSEGELTITVRAPKCSNVLGILTTINHCEKCRHHMYRVANLNDDDGHAHIPVDNAESGVPDFDILFPSAPKNMKKLLLAQQSCLVNMHKGARSHRWNKDVIILCLSLWNQSPASYSHLRNSGFLILPSEPFLSRYKTSVSRDLD